MPAATLVVLNPASRAGATGRRWRHIETRMRALLGPVEVERTRGPRDAERIAREGARAGVERIVVAGGDGTTSEVVSGILGAGLGDSVQLGLLPLGTGGDLVRTLGVPRELEPALERLARGATRRIDAGRVDYTARGGARRSGHFLNVASFGISGLVDERVARAPHLLGGAAAFAWATVESIVRYRPARVRLRVDGDLAYEGPLVFAAAANGRCFGGGMRVAPDAEPDDGLFDVVVVGGLSKLRLLWSLPAIYRGTHLGRPGVLHRRGKRLDVEPDDDAPVLLDVDGEPLGAAPASFELLPGALTVFGVER